MNSRITFFKPQVTASQYAEILPIDDIELEPNKADPNQKSFY